MLRDNGVRHYAYNGLVMTIDPEPPRAQTDRPVVTEKPEIKTPYDHPSLWPGGRRVGFGGK